MSILSGLEPQKVFYYFEEICKIPHGSYHEEKISEYCEKFAKQRNLRCIRDSLNNIIIIKEASKGYENAPAVILQGHLDMVCEKVAGSDFDFLTQGLELKVVDGYVSANDTTLGGDDGIAVAMALAILDSDSIAHPKLEVVFTVSEETGMEGATGIDVSMLDGKMLLNLDSEEEGIFLTSCAGGCHCSMSKAITTTKIGEDHKKVEISICGLKGGHSGTEINKGRANANVIIGRFLLMLQNENIKFNIGSINGGSKDNAIPSYACVNIFVVENYVDFVLKCAKKLENICKSEYRVTDGDIKINAKETSINDDARLALDDKSTNMVVQLLNVVPNGVMRMSDDIQGMVETSLNLGIIKTTSHFFTMDFLLRSSKESSLDYLVDKLRCIAGLSGCDINVSSRYPAWEYRANSKLRDIMVETYEEMFKEKPVTMSIHAGVECGILACKIDDLDCVSFGPNILDIHTPRERLDIKSVERTWKFVLEILKKVSMY